MGVVSGWTASWVAAAGGLLPLWGGASINTLLAYLAFTPLHEACHKNIQAGDPTWEWVENLAGYLCGAVLLVPFPLFRVQHFRHHSFVNHPEKDPDYWVRGPFSPSLLARSLTILPGHYWHFLRHPSSRARALLPGTILLNLVFLLLGALTATRLGWIFPLALWFAPAVLALALLAFAFDWLPHHPHQDQSRFGNSRVFTSRWLDLPLLLQNYHLIHHLRPRIPFYLYREAFQDLREELERGGATLRGTPWEGT